MAPKYAPSLRSRLAPFLLSLQIGFVVVCYFYVEIESNVNGIKFSNLYPVFQDVNVMVFLGFGFLSTFLVRYGFSGSGFNLLIAVIGTQWALLLNGFESWYYRGKIRIDLNSLVVAEMCTASVLISIGAVQGKTNPVHLILMVLLEVFGFVLNEWLLQTLLPVRQLNFIMVLHIFGAFFGLVLTWILYRKESFQGFEKEKLDRKTELFSMLGTVFLWMFWPSFNSILTEERLSAVCSTYLALAVSAVASVAISALFSPKGKVNPAHFQSCILAGGVAVGVSMPAIRYPWEAMTTALAAAAVSTVGFQYLKNHMLFAFECHDTCSVLSTHGLPGLLGWLIQLLLQIQQAIRFAVFHIYALLITLATSLTMGFLTEQEWEYSNKKFSI
ncbi:rh blood group, D antigen isoform X5 [Hippocampus zosterae]|uniref:rh blood group, D antigen isoform X5 n=1 Tax=Hippocampus zosterae TaxID=109293 RepID=UPI00223CBA98|nr:rh blood group, D antigen isoform X5 [Hippocampus zosterae]